MATTRTFHCDFCKAEISAKDKRKALPLQVGPNARQPDICDPCRQTVTVANLDLWAAALDDGDKAKD